MLDDGKALVLFSGGQDSATCLAWALDRFASIETIGFSYGQRHAIELDCRAPLRTALGALKTVWTDFSGYPDCRDDTLKALQVALNLGMNRRFVIHTPLMWIDKAATWRLAEQLGGAELVEIIRRDSHSCYSGNRSILHDWGYGCGTCPACELRARGYAAFIGDAR